MLKSAPSPAAAGQVASRFGASLHVEGEVSGTDDLIVDGSVEGTIRLNGRKLIIGASAKVAADIFAAEIVVYGQVQGALQARDRIEIKKDGWAVGDITTSRIMIEEGAYFRGRIEIDRLPNEAKVGSNEHPERAEQVDRIGRADHPDRELAAKLMPILTGGTPTLRPPSFEHKPN